MAKQPQMFLVMCDCFQTQLQQNGSVSLSNTLRQ